MNVFAESANSSLKHPDHCEKYYTNGINNAKGVATVDGLRCHSSLPRLNLATGERGGTEAESQRLRSREVLSESAAERTSTRVGMEATGFSRWFERLLGELSMVVWIEGCSQDQDQARPQTKDRPSGN
jgi:hypothetical protein